MEAELVEGLNQNIDIWKRGAGAEDSFGNKSSAYIFFDTYKGRFEFLSGHEVRNGSEYVVYYQRVIFDAGVSVAAPDQIRYDERKFQISRVYVRYDWDGTEHHRVAYLEEVE